MAKISDAMMATLVRGSQHELGLISPAAKTPAHMALAQASKMVDAGLVERVACFHDQAWYTRSEASGECFGYRLTAAGFEAVGVDPIEWPAYCAPGADETEGATTVVAAGSITGLVPEGGPDMPAAWDAPGPTEQDMDVADAAAERAAYQEEQEGELAAEDAADQPLVSAADLAASIPLVTGTPTLLHAGHKAQAAALRDAAAALLLAWDACPSQDATDNPISRAVEALRAALPAAKEPKAAKPAGAPGTPREGSKLALVIGMLSRPGGATGAEVEAATGWTNTSTRGFISSLKIKRGLAVGTAKIDGVTRYWIGDAAAPEQSEAAAPKPGAQPAF